MTTCWKCGGLGLSITDSEVSACHCPAGSIVRTRSNRDTILAARNHTDAHDDRMESIRANVAAKLRGAGHAEPEAVPQHTCVSCGEVPVSACGNECLRCWDNRCLLESEEDKRQTAKEARLLCAVLFGLVAGCPIYFAVFKVVGWLP